MNKILLFFLFFTLNLAAQVTNNKLFTWGDNSLAQLGDGTLINKNTPSQVGTTTNWRQIKTGLRHSVAIKNDGSLWTWGDNYYGELGIGSYWFGDGTPRYRANPVRVGLDNDWKQVDGGFAFTIALKNDGSLWGWGNNYEGQLGIGTITGNTPYGWTYAQRIGSSNDWKKISVGNQHVVALKNDGTLWAWGDNYFRQLGDGTDIDKLVPTQIGSDNDWKEIEAASVNTLAIKNNGTLWAFGTYTFWTFNTPTQLGTDTDWKVVSNGAFGRTAIPEGMVIKDDGSLWVIKFTTASPAGFQPVREASGNDWSQISVGYYHVAAIKKDGTLWTWGRNIEGQLGIGTNTTSQATPIQVGISNKWAQVSLGEMFTTALEYECTVPNTPSVSDITYCQNATASPLTATGTNLLWYITATGGTGSTTSPIPSTTTAGTFSYFVSQLDGSCESPRAEIKVTVNTLPTVSITNLNANYCKNATAVTLTGSPTGGTFTIDGIATTSFDPSVLNVGNHTVVYSVTENGCSNSVSQTVAVNALPSIAIAANPTTICAGQTSQLMATVGNVTTGYTVYWDYGGTGDTKTTPPLYSTTTYTALVTTTEGCSTRSNFATISVSPQPAISISANPTTVCAGQTSQLFAMVNGVSNYTVTWNNGLGSGTLKTTPSLSTTTTYRATVTATGGSCSAISNSVTVTVNQCGTDSDCDGVFDAVDLCPGGNDKIDNNHDGKADCHYLSSINQLISAWRCGNNNDKVVMCHIPPDNPTNPQTICVSVNTVATHLAHGDYIGTCGNAKCTTNSTSSNTMDAYIHPDFGKANITWLTNAGYKTDYFEILRLDESKQFERLAVVKNVNFDTQVYPYTFSDNQPLEGENIYIVKAVFNDGSSLSSEMLKVNFDKQMGVGIYPNPTRDEVWIDLKNFEGRSLDIVMSDVAGKVIRHEKVAKATTIPYRLDLINIQSGSYTVTIQTQGKRTVVRKLSIVK